MKLGSILELIHERLVLALPRTFPLAYIRSKHEAVEESVSYLSTCPESSEGIIDELISHLRDNRLLLVCCPNRSEGVHVLRSNPRRTSETSSCPVFYEQVVLVGRGSDGYDYLALKANSVDSLSVDVDVMLVSRIQFRSNLTFRSYYAAD